MQNRKRVVQWLIVMAAVLLLFLGAVTLYLRWSSEGDGEEPAQLESLASPGNGSGGLNATPLPALPPRSRPMSGSDGREGGAPSDNQDSPTNTASTELAERRDMSGMTTKEELDYLLRSHDNYLLAVTDPTATSKQRALADFGLVSRCVATILRAEGRADYGDPQEIKTRGGFVLREHPDEWTFAADRALFRFPKGEFPAYDEMQKQTELLDHEGVEYPSSEEWISGREALFIEALSALGASVPDSK